MKIQGKDSNEATYCSSRLRKMACLGELCAWGPMENPTWRLHRCASTHSVAPPFIPSVGSKSKTNLSVSGWKNKLETARSRRESWDSWRETRHNPSSFFFTSCCCSEINKRASLRLKPAAFYFAYSALSWNIPKYLGWRKREKRNGTKRKREKRD